MRQYWIIWTYVANHSDIFEMMAKSPEDVVDRVRGMYSDDFKKRARIFVFTEPPIIAAGVRS